MLKPHKLQPGDRIATVSLSRGGPGACPERYRIGKQQLEQEFGVQVVEMPHTLADPQWLYEHPEARASDLMTAFKDPSIKAIIHTIGGEESIRMLPFIDRDIVRNNPKIVMGYSDSTITHFICQRGGFVSFYGPSIMSGFAENCGMFPYMVNSVRKNLFESDPIGVLTPNHEGWTNEFLDRGNPHHQMTKRKLQASTPRRWLQGLGLTQGELIGGCIDVFSFLQGTEIRPKTREWDNKILILETSEEQMSTTHFERIIRNLGSQGILQRLNGILLGRSQYNYDTQTQINYDHALLKIINTELGLSHLPIITNLDFGHTDPMMVLPLGCTMQIDCDQQVVSISESATIEVS